MFVCLFVTAGAGSRVPYDFEPEVEHNVVDDVPEGELPCAVSRYCVYCGRSAMYLTPPLVFIYTGEFASNPPPPPDKTPSPLVSGGFGIF